jgi:energy-coupling factor transport system substrate-specific component
LRDAIVMWKHTKLVVLVALTAAAYVAILVPFKIATVVPGFTEIRPAAGIPVVFGLLFGPAAAWGAAFGNLVGDVLGGMLGPGSIPGMLGNFLLAYVPYRMWRALRGDEPATGSPHQIGRLIVCAVAGAMACAVIIGTGVAAMGLVPYGILTPAIALNNGVIGTVVALLLLPLLYPRAYKWGLVYTDLLDARDYRPSASAGTGMAITLIAGVVGAGLGLAFFVMGLVSEGNDALRALSVSVTPVPVGAICSLAIIVGAVLMSPFGGGATAAEPEVEE